ncbi:lytic murein transglycosylase B [Roseateles sp. BYS180W]|uniref:Lytic murein transglycosylase B n=1 Tax=Roseateles rivi TaxID=3299028 RepID=A0ABW7FYA5_9BURK
MTLCPGPRHHLTRPWRTRAQSLSQHSAALLLAAALAAAHSAALAAPASPAGEMQGSAQKSPAAAKKAVPKRNKSSKKSGKAKVAAVEAATPYGQRPDVMAFADSVAAAQGRDATALRQVLAQAQRLARVQQLIMPPAVGTAKDWGAYRDRFIEPRRLQAGLAFWDTHQAALQRAQERWGVPAAVVVSLVGIETFYGRITGGFRVIDALATLSFDFPSGRSDRSAFFRDELTQFLALTQREGLDPLALKGSYAGAMGWGQFMPGSWNRYALDFDGDGHVDLINSPVDAIGSIAHYLAEHGWQTGAPTHFAVTPPSDGAARARLLEPDIRPSFSAADFAAAGAQLSPAGQAHAGPLALVELQMGGATPVYVAGTQNFWVITRYNWSAYYAMAVIEMADTLAALRSGASATAPAASQTTP